MLALCAHVNNQFIKSLGFPPKVYVNHNIRVDTHNCRMFCHPKIGSQKAISLRNNQHQLTKVWPHWWLFVLGKFQHPKGFHCNSFLSKCKPWCYIYMMLDIFWFQQCLASFNSQSWWNFNILFVFAREKASIV